MEKWHDIQQLRRFCDIGSSVLTQNLLKYALFRGGVVLVYSFGDHCTSLESIWEYQQQQKINGDDYTLMGRSRGVNNEIM